MHLAISAVYCGAESDSGAGSDLDDFSGFWYGAARADVVTEADGALPIDEALLVLVEVDPFGRPRVGCGTEQGPEPPILNASASSCVENFLNCAPLNPFTWAWHSSLGQEKHSQ